MSGAVDTVIDGSASDNGDEGLMMPRSDVLLEETKKAAAEVVCVKCGLAVDPFRSIIKSKSRLEPTRVKYVCRSCNAATTMLTRQMCWPPQQFSELSDEQQTAFWKATQEISAADSRLQYSKVRALLVKTLIQRKIIEDSTEVSTEGKPLAVWEKEGYDAQLIEARGKKEHCPVLGDIYSFARKKTCSKVTIQMVEDHIKKAEQSVKQVKKDDDDDESFLSDSSNGHAPKKQKTGKSKGSKKKSQLSDAQIRRRDEKASELAGKKLEQKRAKDNAAVHALASRVMSSVAAPLSECFMALDTIQQADVGSYPASTHQTLKDSYDKLKAFKDEAGVIAKQSLKKVAGHLELEFSQAEFQSNVAEAKQALKSFNDLTKILNRA